MVTQWLYLAIIGLICGERIAELIIAQRNARWSFARGGVEFGIMHYRWMVTVHTLFLLAAPLEVWLLNRPFYPTEAAISTLGLVLAQGLRWWCIVTLKRQWNTRVIIVPTLTRSVAGPYRWLQHPNYVAVVIEGLALPLWHHAYITALGFCLVNSIILSVRIRCEEQALLSLRGNPT